MKVLVTGAAGFIGGHLVDMLVERGDEVRALVRPVEDTSHLRTLTGVEIKHGDLTDAASLKRAMQGVQRVYNVAAKTGPWGQEEAYRAVNVQGLADLIHAAMDAGVQRIVHTSSITVYGHHLHGIVTESYPYHAEDNPYSRTKIAAEVLWQALGRRKAAPPPLTTYGVTLLGGNQQFSIDRARRELGYTPEFDVRCGVAEGVRWYLHVRQSSLGLQTPQEVA